MISPFLDTLQRSLAHLGVPASAEQLALLEDHYQAMLQANQQFNLTRIIEPEAAALRLYADSAAVIAWARASEISATRVLDVGSGAGFPCVPVAVLMPEWQVTAVEATRKKAEFIAAWAKRHSLSNLQAVHAHTTHWNLPSHFDLAMFKAVGPLAECLRKAQPLLRKKAHAVVYKSLRMEPAELDEANQQATAFGFREKPSHEYEWPVEEPPARFRLHVYRKA